MKKLGTVDCAGVEYDVEERSIKEDPHLEASYGYTIHALGLIVLRAGLTPTQFRSTALHEMQHGIWEHSGLSNIEDEETHIQVFTPHLIRALACMRKWRVG